MKKKNRKVLVGILILIVTAGILACRYSINKRVELTRHIEGAIDSYVEGETKNIDIASINFFQWDRVYIFAPYSRCGKIIDILNAPYFWFRCPFSGIVNAQSRSLYVFKRNGFVVGDAILYGPIEENNPSGYSHESAYFIFNERGRLVWDGDQ